MNYYPFHIGDYLSATRHLSWEEDGAYRRLLDVYYTTEKPIPLELKQACRLVLATTESQREAVETVLMEFFEKTPEGWVNHRADVEIEAMKDKQQKQRERVNKRWDKVRSERGIAGNDKDNASGNATVQENDTTVQKIDTNVLPPTPTPTPTPVLKNTEDSSDLLSQSEQPLTDFVIPLVDSTEYRAPVKDFEVWQQAYPAVDVPQELRQMRAWVTANPTKRKTRRGVSAFIVRWLSKAQDMPSRNARPVNANAEVFV